MRSFQETPLVKCVRDFLTFRLVSKDRLLLALSGGGDSLALLFLLIECQKKLDFELHLAHVDHAYRADSATEAKAIKHLAQQLKLPLHLRRLSPYSGPNLEDHFREKRYAFFNELQKEEEFRAVLLAHHADDQGETLLKRVCEGAHLGALSGLKPESKRGHLSLWRPLLPIRKKTLSTYLEKKSIPYFDDATNSDPTYLRARMREVIFPALEKQFGKNIGKNFYRLGHLFQEMGSYLEEKKEKILQQLVWGPFGAYLDQPTIYPSLEMRFFLEEWAREKKAHLSNDSIQTLLRLIDLSATNSAICAHPLSFVLNRNRLFLLEHPFPTFSFKKWTLSQTATDWRDFWKGKVPTSFDNCQFFTLNESDPSLRKKIKKWYNRHQVPPLFHDIAPLYKKGNVTYECLTGKKRVE